MTRVARRVIASGRQSAASINEAARSMKLVAGTRNQREWPKLRVLA